MKQAVYSYTATKLKAGDDCPKCGGELVTVSNRYEASGIPDCSWLWCQDCNYETEPE